MQRNVNYDGTAYCLLVIQYWTTVNIRKLIMYVEGITISNTKICTGVSVSPSKIVITRLKVEVFVVFNALNILVVYSFIAFSISLHYVLMPLKRIC